MVTDADQLPAFVLRHKLALPLHQLREVTAFHVIWVACLTTVPYRAHVGGIRDAGGLRYN